jgi:hypothetical protein
VRKQPASKTKRPRQLRGRLLASAASQNPEPEQPRPRGRPLGSATRSEPVQPLLFDRKQTRQLLGGISEATLIAMEQDHILDSIKLNRSENCKTFYRASQVYELAEKGVPRAEGEGE